MENIYQNILYTGKYSYICGIKNEVNFKTEKNDFTYIIYFSFSS